jgi:DNA-binding response OmpR family regulator
MTREDKKVLIVDDDQDYLFQQKIVLEKAGYQVVTADNRTGAERAFKESSPDIAILDLMMDQPDDGFALCYALKQARPELPVIMVSNLRRESGIDFDSQTHEKRAWIKADAFLAKPVRIEQLRGELKRLLGS